MICKECGIQYHNCKCGVAHHCGTANAEHINTCPEFNSFSEEHSLFVSLQKLKKATNNFELWECPADLELCPTCWHKRLGVV